MSYRITIEKLDGAIAADGKCANEKIYEQTVPEINLVAVMAAVNRRSRKSRAKITKEEL